MSENLDKALDKVTEVAKCVCTEPVMKVVNQRLSNPFFLCFISSWILCNWDRILILLFSFNVGIEQRIEKVKTLPANSVFWGVNFPHAHTFWYPLFASLVFVVGTPFIIYFVDLLQNGVISQKNSNDSKRKINEIDIKMSAIEKNVEFEHKEEQARLTEQKKAKQIELDMTSLKEEYTQLETKIRDQNTLLKNKAADIARQEKSYNETLSSISKMRDELELKNKELKEINGNIISQQKKLDDLSGALSNRILPGTMFGGMPSTIKIGRSHGFDNAFGSGLVGTNGLRGISVEGPDEGYSFGQDSNAIKFKPEKKN